MHAASSILHGSSALLLSALLPIGLARTTAQEPAKPMNPSRSESHPASRPANRLAKEKSPYLLQHAHNPVDWYPWGEEAFAKARAEDKPIFLSIGYSTCHWCHVMERESFEDEAVGRYLSEHFVCIKVDREERPDIDRVYMAYVQAATGSGGWPMSVWLTPDLKPFHGGTYFAPTSQFGRPGFLPLLKRITELWRDSRADLVASAEKATGFLRQQGALAAPTEGALGEETLREGARYFAQVYDAKLGGYGNAPKFPRPSCFLFLMRHAARAKDADALESVEHTLREMARGGIHDHLGGGFHRYSVDAEWHVPHFEKMLYDQGQLAVAYAEAWQSTKDPLFAATLRSLCDYVLRDLTAPEGAFWSAEDADSLSADGEKREGAFYVFTKEEVDAIAGDDAAAFSLRYGVEDGGNASDPHGELIGQNVLHVRRDAPEIAERLGIDAEETARRIASAEKALLAARNARPRPHLDDKILVGWNGLMISGLAAAARVLEEPRFAEAAVRAARYIEERMLNAKTMTLSRRARDGAIGLRAHADDYAYFAQGCLDLYGATLDPHWIDLAARLHTKQDALFRDEATGAYFSSAEGDPSILVRLVEDYDGAEPAPGSVAARNALRLAELTGEDALRARGEETILAFGERLRRFPAALPQMLVALDALLATPQHVVIAGDAESGDTRAMLRAVASRFLPNATLLLVDGAGRQAWLGERLPFVANMKPIGGNATAYVCVNRACRLPVNELTELEKLLP